MLITMAVDVLAMAADRPERLDRRTSRVVSASKTMPSVNRRTPLGPGYLVSQLLLPLLRSGALNPRRPALAPLLAAYSVAKTNQLPVACLELRLLERPVVVSLGLRVMVSAQELQTLPIPLVVQAVFSGSRTTINRNNQRNHSLVVEQTRRREDSDLVAQDLGLGMPIPLVVAYSAAGRQTILSVSHSRIRPRTLFQALDRRTRLRTMLPQRLEDLDNPSNKTRSLVVCSALNQAPILGVACSGLQIILSSKILEDSSVTLRIITKLLPVLSSDKSLPQRLVFLVIQTPTLPTLVEGFLGD